MSIFSVVNTTSVKAAVTGIVARVPIPYPIPNTDGCTCGVKCPVKSGDINTYKYGLFVKPEYPTVSSNYLLYRLWFQFDPLWQTETVHGQPCKVGIPT